MPGARVLLPGYVADFGVLEVEFLVEFGVNGADFWICDAVVLALGVEDGVDV